jgi:hypothetical protein
MSTNISTQEGRKVAVGERQRSMLISAGAVRIRLAALSLAVSGILFVLYPAIRPFSDEASLQGARAFASPQWILAHVLAILGFILMTLALLGLYFTFLQRCSLLAPISFPWQPSFGSRSTTWRVCSFAPW